MESRREFLKEAATGALVLGAHGKWALAKAVEPHAEAGKSRVVIARDPALHSADGKLDEGRVIALLDRAMTTYTGRDKPVEAWKQIIANGGAEDKVIGIKTNGLGGSGISTHAALVFAIAHRLEEAGVKSGQHPDLGSQCARSSGLRVHHLDGSGPAALLRLRCVGIRRGARQSWGTAKSGFRRFSRASARWSSACRF